MSSRSSLPSTSGDKVLIQVASSSSASPSMNASSSNRASTGGPPSPDVLVLIGGTRAYHVMSVLLAEHSHSRGILGFLTYEDANSLRSVCKELRDEVSAFRWTDMSTCIKGRLDLWRTCFPRAISANLSHRCDLKEEDFLHLLGIKHLDVTGQEYPWREGQMTFPDASFEHIRGIQSLNMSFCRQLTDAAFAHLTGIHTLDMSYCAQETITGSTFHYLSGITRFETLGCRWKVREDADWILGIAERHGTDALEAW